MIQYELLDKLEPRPTPITIEDHSLPELVHLEDPAFSVMRDFAHNKPQTTQTDTPMPEAKCEMRLTHSHSLLVANENGAAVGIVTSEDLLGEKPIQIIQERRIERDKVTVGMLMTKLEDIPAFSYEDVARARVGNIVATLKAMKLHFALVIDCRDDQHTLRGWFNTSQMSKQLHMEIEQHIGKASSVSELSDS